MTAEKLEKIQEKASNNTMLHGVYTFISLTYVIIFTIMIKAYTVLPLIAALVAMGYFIYSLVKDIELLNKIKR